MEGLHRFRGDFVRAEGWVIASFLAWAPEGRAPPCTVLGNRAGFGEETTD